MSDIEVTLRADLLIKPASGASSAEASAGTTIPIALRDANRVAGGEISQVCQNINSPSAFVALPFPANLQARVLVLKCIERAGPFSLRLTQLTAGTTTIAAFQGTMILEVAEGEEITSVELQGEGDITWAATGPTT